MCMSRAIKSTCESSSFKLHSLPALRTRFQNLKKMGLTEGDGCERSALLLAKLNHQRMKAEFCDCVIRKGQGQIFPVHKCSLCERSFSQRGSLNRHVKSHLGVRPFPCPQCPMSFSRQYRVTEHMRVHQRSALGADCTKPSTV
uniref:C2H2-type domain-containing protein n=1 Tax=Knipowitschia caucasica TaxID=637954 RepID=A0AAV2LP95_KNICA